MMDFELQQQYLTMNELYMCRTLKLICLQVIQQAMLAMPAGLWASLDMIQHIAYALMPPII